MKTCVLIPTYNEAEEIGNIIARIKNLQLEVLVIDDGSQDDTVKISEEKGAIVVKNTKNEGKGASLIKGFNYALKNGFEAVVTMDGDGQHIPENISYFTEKAKASKNLFFIGNRMASPSNMPLIRKMTNAFMSWFISLIAKQSIPDTQCGFRLIKRELLEKIKLNTTHYETESEILVMASKLGCKIESVAIETIYSGEISQINPLIDTFRFLRFVINQFLNHHNVCQK